ncbi:MAG: hypothetical protein ABR978_05925 [Dehalococcoidia bacterium]
MALDEVFEDGIDNAFSRTIPTLLERHGHIVIDALNDLYAGGLMPAHLFSEILPWLGRTQTRDRLDHNARFWFLVLSLRDSHSSVRSGAALGLASLGDYRAITHLRTAAASETIALLRCRLTQIADELSPW